MNSNQTGSEKKLVSGQANGSQMRITPREMEVIRSLFKGNDEALRLMRKIFLPELDPTAPIGQMVDLWMTVNIKDMTPEMAYITILARNTVIQHVDQQLQTLSLIAKLEPETPEEVTAKLKANSTK